MANPISRRTFLRLAGAAAAVVVAEPVIAQAQQIAPFIPSDRLMRHVPSRLAAQLTYTEIVQASYGPDWYGYQDLLPEPLGQFGTAGWRWFSPVEWKADRRPRLSRSPDAADAPARWGYFVNPETGETWPAGPLPAEPPAYTFTIRPAEIDDLDRVPVPFSDGTGMVFETRPFNPATIDPPRGVLVEGTPPHGRMLTSRDIADQKAALIRASVPLQHVGIIPPDDASPEMLDALGKGMGERLDRLIRAELAREPGSPGLHPYRTSRYRRRRGARR